MSSKSLDEIEIHFRGDFEDNIDNNEQSEKQNDSQLLSLLFHDLPPLELYTRQTKKRKRSISSTIESDELEGEIINQTKSQVDFFELIDPNPLNKSMPLFKHTSIKQSIKELNQSPSKPKVIVSSFQETPFLNTSLDKNDQLTRTSCHCFYPTSHMIYLDQKVDMNHLWMKYLLPNPLMESMTMANYDLSSTTSTLSSKDLSQESFCQHQQQKLNQFSQEHQECQECHKEKLTYKRTYVMSKYIDYNS